MVKSSKKIIVIESILLVCVVVLFFMQNNGENNKIITNEKEQNILSSNAISMMYETEAGSGEYQTSTDTNWPQEGYIFNERLSGCENGGTLSWNEDTKRVIMQTNTADKCYVYFDVYEPTLKDYLLTTVYKTDGVNDLYYHDGEGIYSTLEANDYSYRYAGANPNNYVCFGTVISNCPDDYLYRIIGIFDKGIKLIKNKSIGNYDIGANSYTPWSDSDLNINILNGSFLNSFSNWGNLIKMVSWHVGGISATGTPKTLYDNEVGINAINTTFESKIGLMYASDYAYAASANNWNTDVYNYNSNSNNWLYSGVNESTIALGYDNPVIRSFYITENGSMTMSFMYNSAIYATRPTFYLESNVLYLSGDGTLNNPYTIKF